MTRRITLVLTALLVIAILLYQFFHLLTMSIVTVLLGLTIISYFVQLFVNYRKK
ncbi:hypothetical protein [Sporolactobacillus nakayamae]|uniref:Uncharacterized protein n=1 Tax=Sporolactobacillus nakayamae TaxID=269670 RepID=A0A1I2R8W6_9BACL|nr:hypothetical protein [Sporolactobacillus nakayamae]SFG36493.1 hypothetical protein SAMN02982927_01468 [Sporolactobacillus nakayamae]